MHPAAWIWIVLIVAALVTSAISGVLGMAGGIALLGVMTAVLAEGAVVPLHGVVQLSSNFTRTIVFLRDVRWKVFLIYAVPVAAGVAVASLIWSSEKLSWFRPAIGVFILVFLWRRRKEPKLRRFPLWIYVPLGLVTGFLTIFVGATGPFIAPFFLRDDFSKENVVATKAACQSWGHVLKIPAFLALGFDFVPHLPLLGAMVAAVIAGTIVGKSILKKISKRVFTAIFEIVLAGIAAYLILAWAVPLFST